jgi:hypothetical protein
MNLNTLLGRHTIKALVDIDIEKTQESFHAYAVPHDFEAREGDEVLLHGVPTDIAFGTTMLMQCSATLRRAGALERAWTRFSAMFEITELYEVGFQPKDDIDNGFIQRAAR